jgi:AcrR family transcriptional regulator
MVAMAETRHPHARRPAHDRRREIADAALRVVAERGLGGFTALAIAREVELTDGALFRHFSSKEAIVDAALDRVEELLFAGFPPRDADPIARLGAFFHGRVAAIRANPGISRLLVSEELSKAASPAGMRHAAELRQRSIEFVRGCIAEARRRELLAPGLGAEEAAIVVLGAILALGHSTLPAEPPVEVAPRVWDALEALLRGTPTRRRGGGPDGGRRASRQPRGDEG